MAANGPVGPFNTTNEVFVLTNSGTGSIEWTLGEVPNWLSASMSGSVLPAGQGTKLTLAISSDADSLPDGVYAATVWFTNITSGYVQERQFTLKVRQALVENGGFETGNFSGWTGLGFWWDGRFTDVDNSASVAHSGSHYANLIPHYVLNEYNPNTYLPTYLSQTIPTLPGHVYEISFWLQDYVDMDIDAGHGPSECAISWGGNTVLDLVSSNSFFGAWSNVVVQATATRIETRLQFALSAGHFYLDDVSVSLQTNVEPAVLAAPASISVELGGSNALSVLAVGTLPLSFHWWKDGVELNGGSQVDSDSGSQWVLGNAREELGSSNAGLPVRKATDYALQIAQGLAAAHGRGIIHRDLKPENIFVTKDGRVKILDFGLAKLHGNFTSQISDLKSVDGEAPTLADSTQPGMVLGTPSYMSPEQVRGEPADHRSDIFAFGCVLYEMLSGTRVFRRDTPVESMNAVLREDPPEINPRHKIVAPALERIVRRCLEKQGDSRFQSAKDLAFALENAGGAIALPGPGSHVSAPRRPSSARLLPLLPWAACAALAVALGVMYWRASPPNSSTVAAGSKTLRRFDLTLPLGAKPQANGNPFTPALSPDGKKIAFANADGLWLRWLDRTAPVQLASGKNIVSPFWSPDSSEVGYFERRQVFRVSIEAGAPSLVCPTPEDTSTGAGGGAWLTRDRIVFGTGRSGLYEVGADGGRVTSICPPEPGSANFGVPGVDGLLAGGSPTSLPFSGPRRASISNLQGVMSPFPSPLSQSRLAVLAPASQPKVSRLCTHGHHQYYLPRAGAPFSPAQKETSSPPSCPASTLSIRRSGTGHIRATNTHTAIAIHGFTNASGSSPRYNTTDVFPFQSRPRADLSSDSRPCFAMMAHCSRYQATAAIRNTKP